MPEFIVSLTIPCIDAATPAKAIETFLDMARDSEGWCFRLTDVTGKERLFETAFDQNGRVAEIRECITGEPA